MSVRAPASNSTTECTGPVTRLLRQGFIRRLSCGNFLPSCKDAYCMIAAGRRHSPRQAQQIVIDDHCIGCGLCANTAIRQHLDGGDQNRMVEKQRAMIRQRPERIAQPKAATCDLCDAQGQPGHAQAALRQHARTMRPIE